MFFNKYFIKGFNRTNKMKKNLKQNITSVVRIAFFKDVFKFVVNALSHFKLRSKYHTTLKKIQQVLDDF